MINSFTCAFCGSVVAIDSNTRVTRTIGSHLKTERGEESPGGWSIISTDQIRLTYQHCPSCEKTEITATGEGSQFKGKTWSIFPDSRAKQLPNYIPASIVEDYEEACKILTLSPKSSATLSRRCLQGMIRDFWSIKKSRLIDEIDALDDKVDQDTKEVLHSLRQLGNIGAHPEKDISLIVDIEPEEAEQLVLFLEYLFEEWYIKQHQRKSMLQRINQINVEKKKLKNKNN